MKKCEVFACPNESDQMYKMAPGSIVWLCDECIKEMEFEVEKEADKESVSASGLARHRRPRRGFRNWGNAGPSGRLGNGWKSRHPRLYGKES